VPVAGGHVSESFGARQPGVGDGRAALTQGAADLVEGFNAVAGMRLELGEAADLVGGEQGIARGLGRVDGGTVAGAGGAVVAHVPG
jgi:hypothetical protein